MIDLVDLPSNPSKRRKKQETSQERDHCSEGRKVDDGDDDNDDELAFTHSTGQTAFDTPPPPPATQFRELLIQIFCD